MTAPNLDWVVYALIDPRDAEVRYIGKTLKRRLDRRLVRHVEDALTLSRRNHRLNWIRDVLNSGRMPSMLVLERGIGDWAAAERRWIDRFRKSGFELVNQTDGGEGCPGVNPSEDTRKKLRAAWTEERRIRMSARHLGRKPSSETCEKIRLANIGKKASAEARLHMRLAHLGKPTGRLGKKHSAEACEHMRQAQKARFQRERESRG